MNVTTAIEEVKKAAQAKLPVLLLGPPGCGKTSIPSAVAEDMDLPLWEVRPAEFEPVDFRGIPTVEKNRTTWNPPDIWPDVDCVLNIDELTQAPMELTSPLLKLFLGRQVGNYKLPDGVILMATGNNVSDRAGCSRLSTALRERCIIINIEPDFSEWTRWYSSQSFRNDSVEAFLKVNPSEFHKWDSKLDFNQPTPRNWERLSRIMPFEPAEETIAGIIGPPTAKSFHAFCRTQVRMPSVAGVLKGTEGQPLSPALAARFMDACAEFAATDYTENASVNMKDLAALVETYAGTYQVQFLKAVAKKNVKILNNGAMTKLVKKHAAAIVGSSK